jgi:carbamoylphosphate synthase small subunit
LQINRVPDSLKDSVCTKFGQNPLKHVDSRVFTRMLRKEGRTDGSVTISLHNFVGKGIKKHLTSTNTIHF